MGNGVGGSYTRPAPDAESTLVERTGERTECLQNQSHKYLKDVPEEVKESLSNKGKEGSK